MATEEVEELPTFKQYLKGNPHLLEKKENAFINKPQYAWGAVGITDAYNRIAEIQEVYDLVETKFYYKQPLPFEHMGGMPEGHFLFKPLNMSQATEVSLAETLEKYAELKDEYTGFIVEYPNEYGIKNKVLLISRINALEGMTNDQREIYIVMNTYINLVLRRGKVYSLPAPDENAPFPVKESYLHWVWFRKAGFQLEQTQMYRVVSWLDLNPDLTFYLWTDMEDEAELDDFLKNVHEEHRNQLKDRVVVKYRADILAFTEAYFKKHANDRAIQNFNKERFLEVIRSRDNSTILIAKTDYLRAMILHEMGGFYADFNDCQCLMPLRYWMKELYTSQEIIWPCDSFNPQMISNYFLYIPIGSKKFERYHYSALAGFDGLWTLMKDPESKKRIAKIYLDLAKKYLKKLKLTSSDRPLKLLVETVLPSYGSGKYLGEMEEIISKVGIKGIEFCDPRGRAFLPMYCIDYIGRKTNDADVKAFYKYMSAEVGQTGHISLKQNFSMNNDGKTNTSNKEPERGDMYNIMYITRGYFEEHDDIEDVITKCDFMLEKVATLYDDEEFIEFIYKKFLINMNIAIVALTNIMLHKDDSTLTNTDVVPFSFAYLSFCYLSLVLHWGEGTSVQV